MDIDGAGPGPSSEAQARSDGRSPMHLRTLTCDRGVLHRADGSARWAQGGTGVLAAVFGPQSIAQRKEDPEKAIVEVKFTQRANSAGTARDRMFERLIRRTVEGVLQAALHPRTSIGVSLQVLSVDGGLLACALNAACAALVDAAVPLNNTFVAASVAIDAAGTVLVDPDAEEERAARANGCFAFTAHQEQLGGEGEPCVAEGVLTCEATGSMTMDEYLGMLGVARRACVRIAAFNRTGLEKVFQPP